MAVEFPEFLVLFDLDGVLVVEDRLATNKQLYFLLHEDLQTISEKFAAPIGILTHRPRREARAILSAAGIDDSGFYVIYCAEDLFRLAINRGKFFELLHTGLKKSYAIVDISQRLKIPPDRICVIDDRAAIIKDLEGHGVGLRLHVKQESFVASACLVRFDPDEVSEIFKKWASHRGPAVTVTVQGPKVAREQLQLFDLELSNSSATWFEWSRPIGRRLRKSLSLAG